MKRLVALMVAGLFAAGALNLPAGAAEKKTGAPARTEAPLPPKPDPAAKKAGEDLGAGAAHALDINTATADELKMLPGVGEAYAKKIVDNRPYKRKSDLVKRHVVPKATYDGIKDRITAATHDTAKTK